MKNSTSQQVACSTPWTHKFTLSPWQGVNLPSLSAEKWGALMSWTRASARPNSTSPFTVLILLCHSFPLLSHDLWVDIFAQLLHLRHDFRRVGTAIHLYANETARQTYQAVEWHSLIVGCQKLLPHPPLWVALVLIPEILNIESPHIRHSGYIRWCTEIYSMWVLH